MTLTELLQVAQGQGAEYIHVMQIDTPDVSIRLYRWNKWSLEGRSAHNNCGEWSFTSNWSKDGIWNLPCAAEPIDLTKDYTVKPRYDRYNRSK